MRKHKWFIPVLVAVLLIGGITGGLVVAANNSSSNTTAENQTQAINRFQVLLDRVCAIYEEKTGVAIDSGQLKAALEQARSEMLDEAVKSWLQKIVDKGRITQKEADQLLEWWQSRPNIKLQLPGLGRPGHGGGMMWGRGFEPQGRPWCGANASAEAGD